MSYRMNCLKSYDVLNSVFLMNAINVHFREKLCNMVWFFFGSNMVWFLILRYYKSCPFCDTSTCTHTKTSIYTMHLIYIYIYISSYLSKWISPFLVNVICVVIECVYTTKNMSYSCVFRCGLYTVIIGSKGL